MAKRTRSDTGKKMPKGKRNGGGTRRRSNAAVSVFNMTAQDWQPAGKPGLYLKAVRADQKTGQYLGLVRVDAGCSTGVHQHLDVATSLFLGGSLTDFAGTADKGMVGINVHGDTHDAISYDGCVLASRLDGPVVYPPEGGEVHGLHTGARKGGFEPVAIDRQPDINIDMMSQRAVAMPFAGATRRTMFDYGMTPHDRRMACLQLQPGAHLPMHRSEHPIEYFVVAGDLTLSGETATSNSFAIAEPGAQIELASSYGCLALIWADGPSRWLDHEAPEPYGF